MFWSALPILFDRMRFGEITLHPGDAIEDELFRLRDVPMDPMSLRAATRELTGEGAIAGGSGVNARE